MCIVATVNLNLTYELGQHFLGVVYKEIGYFKSTVLCYLPC